MSQLVPPRFLFRWSFSVRRLERRLHHAGRLLGLSEEFLVPSLGELDNSASFADVRMAWSNEGIGLSIEVSGRSRPPKCLIEQPTTSDGLHVWLDTRNTQTVHRATKFCQQFSLLPIGGGSNGGEPLAIAIPMARARDEAALPEASLIELQSSVRNEGYWLDAWLPKEVLFGYEPSSHSSLGFHFAVRDSQLGEQTLAVNSEFPYASDPSLWQTIVLSTD